MATALADTPRTDDAQLADLALAVLEQSPHLARSGLTLEARDGRLVVRGKVRSYFHKQMAQETLRHVDGVEQIENLLEVHW